MDRDKTTLARLLRYPHSAVFDKSPAAELALRVNHASGLKWAVAEEVLTIVTGGEAVHRYDLPGLKLDELASELLADGFEVPYLSSTLRGLSAAVLVEGSGDQAESNGDHLVAYTSILWVILSAYARELRDAGWRKDQALRQMIIPQAEDYWLDVWGTLYGVGRKPGELDPDYARRIPEEAFRIRVNAIAIEKAIFDLTGKQVWIMEPWKQVFRLSVSPMSGTHRLHDGDKYGYHLIQPVARTGIDWDDVIPIIHRNRAAGVLVLAPRIDISGMSDARLAGVIWFGMTQESATHITVWDSARLGWMVLSEDGIVRNYSPSITSATSMSNTVSVSWGQAGGKWDGRSWRDPSAASDLNGAVFFSASESE